MTMTTGQQDALRQLASIASRGPAFELLSADVPETDGAALEVDITMSFDGIERNADGIPLRSRERFRFSVPPDFPFRVPTVTTRHNRWAGCPHVQWARQLCIYLAPDSEWNPSDGMFGFVDRLNKWVHQGAINQLDPSGAALHPPIAYVTDSSTPLVIPYADAPTVKDTAWLGFGRIEYRSDKRIDVSEWTKLGEPLSTSPVAAAVLLPRATSFEFPSNVHDLLDMLESQGVQKSYFLKVLGLAATYNGDDTPLLILIGTPSRGISGSGDYQQNLVAWFLEPTIAQALKMVLEQLSDWAKLREIGAEVERIILDWAKDAKVTWCYVSEARPEVTVRRDKGSPLESLRPLTVAVWGCGAIGAHVAEALVRVGVNKLILQDNRIVTPGVLVRQPFVDDDIGKSKATATRDRLLRVFPKMDIQAEISDVLRNPLGRSDQLFDVDLVIDATASSAVAQKLEAFRRSQTELKFTIASMVVGHEAERGLLCVSKPSYTGSCADIARKTKIVLLRKSGLRHFERDFWPETPPDPFQPEPGCSAPTFVGSQAQMMNLVGAMLNSLATEIKRNDVDPAYSHLVTVPGTSISRGEQREEEFHFAPDICLADGVDNYDVRVAPGALADLMAWIHRSARMSGTNVETGGHFYGERDDAAKVIWISEVSGPPPDSRASAAGFVCGFEGVQEASNQKQRRSRGSIRFLGMWHTHPDGPPIPSCTDYEGMREIVERDDTSTPRALLLIVGGQFDGTITATASLFSRGHIPTLHELQRSVVPTETLLPHLRAETRDVGLALSGGGSRAIAFQLGCMRALHDRNVLSRVDVVSGVSGGSILAAMYSYSDDDFPEFDERVQKVLRAGLQRRFLTRLIFSYRLPQILVTWLATGPLIVAAWMARSFLPPVLSLTGMKNGALTRRIRNLRSPFRRWVSRTHAFEDILRKNVVGDALLADKRRDDINVVLNATELRTGSAFRFGSRESGTWRFGRIEHNDVTVSHAVAASAAYPTLLPTFDDIIEFEKNGAIVAERTILADGGIFDNLGTSCFDPDRSTEFSFNVYHPRYIISCDAGRGLFDDGAMPSWWIERVTRAAESMFRKAQDGARTRLFQFAANNQISGLLVPYLGTFDSRLPYLPSDLVRRDEVAGYPTDFASMRQEDIDRLSLRGEQITRMLITYYLPDL